MNNLNFFIAWQNSHLETSKYKNIFGLIGQIAACICLTFYSGINLNAQCNLDHDCDPALTSVSIDETCIFVTGTATITLGWEMQGDDPDCLAPEGSWRIQISLPLGGEYGVMDHMSTNGTEFTWTYDAGNATLNGISNTDIIDDAAGTIEVVVTGFLETTCSTKGTSANLFIVPQFQGGCPGAFSNTTGNDAQATILGISTIVLPIVMIGFDAYKKNRSSVLEWSTALEINADNYEILRSYDGRQYEVIGKVKAAGNSEEITSYDFVDKSPYSGANYYQLRQSDRDGSVSMSPVKIVSFDQEDIVIHPNPVIEYAWITLPSSWSDAAWTLEIYNRNLQLVQRENKDKGASTRQQLDLSSYDAGLYLVRFKSGDMIINKEVINIK